jgi:hypothetical protein
MECNLSARRLSPLLLALEAREVRVFVHTAATATSVRGEAGEPRLLLVNTLSMTCSDGPRILYTPYF